MRQLPDRKICLNNIEMMLSGNFLLAGNFGLLSSLCTQEWENVQCSVPHVQKNEKMYSETLIVQEMFVKVTVIFQLDWEPNVDKCIHLKGCYLVDVKILLKNRWKDSLSNIKMVLTSKKLYLDDFSRMFELDKLVCMELLSLRTWIATRCRQAAVV